MNSLHVVIIDQPDRFEFSIEESANDNPELRQVVANHVALRLQTKANHAMVLAKIEENRAFEAMPDAGAAK